MATTGAKAVVVEDDASLREAIECLLGAAGSGAVAYPSVEDLLMGGGVLDAACVISDLRLPGKSGLELLAELRARGWRAPLILITAFDAPGLGEDAMRRGAAACFVKPFHGTALLAAVRAAIAPLASS